MYIHCMYVTHWLSRKAKRMGLTDFEQPVTAYIEAELDGRDSDYVVLKLYWGCGWAVGTPHDITTRWIESVFGEWVDSSFGRLNELQRAAQVGVSDGRYHTDIIFPRSTFGRILKSVDGENIRLV